MSRASEHISIAARIQRAAAATTTAGSLLVFATQLFANSTCFQNPEIAKVIRTSEVMDFCFASDVDTCGLKAKPVDVQKQLNSKRLTPRDRLSPNNFLDRATGKIMVTFGEYDGRDSKQTYSASGVKISRCHVITSAHLLYEDGVFPLISKEYKIKFLTGQTCDAAKPFSNQVNTQVVYKMTKEREDWECAQFNNEGRCVERSFYGHADILVVRLEKFDPEDRSFFSLNTMSPNRHPIGEKIDCFGYPGHSRNLSVSPGQSDLYLWSQRSASIFGDKDGQVETGVMTNAVSYKGMSGGGCVLPTRPQELVGIFANFNRVDGISAIDITYEKADANGSNYISMFNKLAARYASDTGKSIHQLDNECDPIK